MSLDHDLRIAAGRRRGIIRLSYLTLEHPAIATLTDREFRCWISLVCWHARFAGEEAKKSWIEKFGFISSGAPRRMSAALYEKFLALGLIEEREYSDGETMVAILGWRDYRHNTDAERQARRRKVVYGDKYTGFVDDVAIVEPPPSSDEEIRRIREMEAEGRSMLEEESHR